MQRIPIATRQYVTALCLFADEMSGDRVALDIVNGEIGEGRIDRARRVPGLPRERRARLGEGDNGSHAALYDRPGATLKCYGGVRERGLCSLNSGGRICGPPARFLIPSTIA